MELWFFVVAVVVFWWWFACLFDFVWFLFIFF